MQNKISVVCNKKANNKLGLIVICINMIHLLINLRIWLGGKKFFEFLSVYNRGQNLLTKFKDMYKFGSIRMNSCLLFTISPLPPEQFWV